MTTEETKKITLTHDDVIAVMCEKFALDPDRTSARAVTYIGVDGDKRFGVIVEETQCN